MSHHRMHSFPHCPAQAASADDNRRAAQLFELEVLPVGADAERPAVPTVLCRDDSTIGLDERDGRQRRYRGVEPRNRVPLIFPILRIRFSHFGPRAASFVRRN